MNGILGLNGVLVQAHVMLEHKREQDKSRNQHHKEEDLAKENLPKVEVAIMDLVQVNGIEIGTFCDDDSNIINYKNLRS